MCPKAALASRQGGGEKVTEAEQVAANVDRRHMKEWDWASLVNQIKEHKLIPVLGPDLMRVPCGDGSITYERYIAQQLAQMPKYKLTDADFDRFGVTLNDATLNDVVSVLKKKYLEDWPFELHGQVWNIVNESPVPIPDALKQLAKITDFDLVVTSTFDPLMERALRERGPLETRIYRRSEKEDMADLPKDVGKRADRFLYYLFGRAEPGREDFPICDEELLRVLIKLHDAKYRPKRLFDALREKHLLLLGVNFSDWLARF